MKVLTLDEMLPILEEHDDPTKMLSLIRRWTERGDAAAIYRNVDLSSPAVGTTIIVSYGSADAQIETPEPPETLPDIGDIIGWRYRLEGVFRYDPTEVS